MQHVFIRRTGARMPSANSRLSSTDISGRRTYDLIDEPSGDEYRALLDTAASKCTMAVVHLPATPTAHAQEVIEQLAEFRHGDVNGTTARYDFNRKSLPIFLGAADRLYAWKHPDLPANLSLFREDGTPWLISVSEQRLGYLELTPFEKLLLARAIPAIGASLAYEAAYDAIMVYLERRWEDVHESLGNELVTYADQLQRENPDGVEDAVRAWLQSRSPERVEVALQLIRDLNLQEFWDEVNELLESYALKKTDITPAVFRSHPVLRDRWRTRYVVMLQNTLDALESHHEGETEPYLVDTPADGQSDDRQDN